MRLSRLNLDKGQNIHKRQKYKEVHNLIKMIDDALAKFENFSISAIHILWNPDEDSSDMNGLLYYVWKFLKSPPFDF